MRHDARKHAKWSFSNTHRWSRCYGQPNLLATVPLRQRTSTVSDDGTLAHEVLEVSLKTDIRGGMGSPAIEDSVAMVLEYVDELRAEYPDLVVKSEMECEFPQDIVPKKDCAGILDIVGYSEAARHGWIIDFKHGKMLVEAEENDQLLSGATAAFWRSPVDLIDLVIIQPRAYKGEKVKPARTIHSYELLDYQDYISTALIEASKPDAPLIPGDHCMWCDAEPVCLARERFALEEVLGATDARALPVSEEVYTKAVDLAPDRITAILRAKAGAVAWFNSVWRYAIDRAIHGENFPFFKLVEAAAQRHWEGDPKALAEELIMLSNYVLTLDDVMPRELINITAVEPILAKITREQAATGKKRKAVEQFNQDFAFLTTKASSGSYTLVPHDDTRPAVKPLEKAFGRVVVEPFEPQPPENS